VAVVPLPDPAKHDTGCKPGRASDDRGREHDPEKEPESADEIVALELCAKIAPGKWSRPQESHEKSAEARQILDVRAAQLIELRQNRFSGRCDRNVQSRVGIIAGPGEMI